MGSTNQNHPVEGAPMSEESYGIEAPEPKPIDEENSLKLGHLVEDAALRGKPYGDERCGNCLYFLDDDQDISTAGTPSCASWSATTGGASGGRTFRSRPEPRRPAEPRPAAGPLDSEPPAMRTAPCSWCGRLPTS